MEVSCGEEWNQIIEYVDENYDKAIIVLKARLKSRLFAYTNYYENEVEEEIFYFNKYDEACSIAERNKFLWFMRDPVIFFGFIKFYLIKKLNIKRR